MMALAVMYGIEAVPFRIGLGSCIAHGFACVNRNGGGEGLAIRPDRAIGKGLALPDGDGLLEGVDDPAASLEALAAMAGSDNDEHTGVAYFVMAEAVDDGDAMDAESRARLYAQLAQLAKGHFFIALVIEVESGAPAAVVADAAVKDDDGAVLRGGGVANEFLDGNALAREADRDELIFIGRGSAAGDWRQQGDLVAFVENMGGGGVFGIYADSDAAEQRR